MSPLHKSTSSQASMEVPKPVWIQSKEAKSCPCCQISTVLLAIYGCSSPQTGVLPFFPTIHTNLDLRWHGCASLLNFFREAWSEECWLNQKFTKRPDGEVRRFLAREFAQLTFWGRTSGMMMLGTAMLNVGDPRLEPLDTQLWYVATKDVSWACYGWILNEMMFSRL